VNGGYEYICMTQFNPMRFKFTCQIFLCLLTLVFSNCFSLIAMAQKKELSGDLIIFHAGSLSVPIKDISAEFNKLYPKVRILAESAGSVASARKITDLDRPCDIMASSDYGVIDAMLIPRFADWNLKFASNEMTVVYSGNSRYASEINERNWYETLMKPEVFLGRADPNSDPCGYRTVMALQLAEQYYKKPGMSRNILSKNQEFIRPKEVDMVALLESGSIDYCFLYRSVAIQHKLRFISFPDQVNLKNPDFAKLYASAKVEVNGNKPGEKQQITGEPMIYSVTILRNAPNKPVAEAFLTFLLSKNQGIKILEKDGQPSVVPMSCANYDKLPALLRPFAKQK